MTIYKAFRWQLVQIETFCSQGTLFVMSDAVSCIIFLTHISAWVSVYLEICKGAIPRNT